MKKLKKICLTICSLTLMIGTLSGCGTSDHGLDAKNPVKITMWHYYSSSQKNAFDKLVAEFNTTLGKEKGIMVEAIPQGGINELERSLKASADKEVGAANMPDLFSAYASNAIEIDQTYGLADLNTYLSKSEKEEYIQGYLDEGYLTQDDRLLLFPIAKATELMFINKTAWDVFANESDVQPDDLKTWEGLVEVSKKYYQYSNGKAFFGRDAMANYMLSGTTQLKAPMFEINKQDVSYQLDKTALRKLWDNYYIPYIQGYFLANGKYASDDLKTSDIIAYVGSTSSSAFFPTTVSQNESETQSIDYMILPVPNFAGYDPIAVQQGASVAVSKGEETKEYASVLFLRWLSDTQRNLAYAAETGYLPVKKDATFDMLAEDTSQTMKPIVKDTLKISMEQVSNSQLYTFDAFDESSEVRNILEFSLNKQAKQDRSLIREAIQNGEDEQSVIAKYASDDSFQAWYESFSSQISKVLE